MHKIALCSPWQDHLSLLKYARMKIQIRTFGSKENMHLKKNMYKAIYKIMKDNELLTEFFGRLLNFMSLTKFREQWLFIS